MIVAKMKLGYHGKHSGSGLKLQTETGLKNHCFDHEESIWKNHNFFF